MVGGATWAESAARDSTKVPWLESRARVYCATNRVSGTCLERRRERDASSNPLRCTDAHHQRRLGSHRDSCSHRHARRFPNLQFRIGGHRPLHLRVRGEAHPHARRLWRIANLHEWLHHRVLQLRPVPGRDVDGLQPEHAEWGVQLLPPVGPVTVTTTGRARAVLRSSVALLGLAITLAGCSAPTAPSPIESGPHRRSFPLPRQPLPPQQRPPPLQSGSAWRLIPGASPTRRP